MNYYNFSGSYEYGGGVMGGMPAETREEARDAILRQFPDVRNLDTEK